MPFFPTPPSRWMPWVLGVLSLCIVSVDAASAAASLRVTRGASPTVTYESTVGFPTANASSSNTQINIRIYNDGPSPLTINAIRIAQLQGNAFSLAWNASAPSFTVASGSYKSFRVVLDRSSSGYKKARVRIFHNATNASNPFSFKVDGTTNASTPTQPPPRPYQAAWDQAMKALMSYDLDAALPLIESLGATYAGSHVFLDADYRILVAELYARSSQIQNSACPSDEGLLRVYGILTHCIDSATWDFLEAFDILSAGADGTARTKMVLDGWRALLHFNARGKSGQNDAHLMTVYGASCETQADQVISTYPQLWDGYLWKGLCRFMSRSNLIHPTDYNVAITNLNQAISLGAPGYLAQYWKAVARYHRVANGDPTSVSFFNTALALHASNAEALFWRSRAFSANNQTSAQCNDVNLYLDLALGDLLPFDDLGWNAHYSVVIDQACLGPNFP